MWEGMDKRTIEGNFSWQIWTPNTKFLLCNVPWDMSYRDVVQFRDDKDRDSWFEKLHDTRKVERGTMSKFGLPIRLEIPFNQASKYNYIVVYNDYPGLEVPRKWFYFIQTVEFVNATVTQFNIMLDVWQSFQFDIKLGMCYVERGHVAIANEHSKDDHGRDYLAIPEGLDTGGDATIVHQDWRSLLKLDANSGQVMVDQSAGVIVVSNVDLVADGGDVKNPSLRSATGSLFENLVNGCEFYYFDSAATLMQLFNALSSKPWMSQGIVAIYLVPKMRTRVLQEVSIQGVKAYKTTISEPDREIPLEPVKNFRDNFRVPDRYRNLWKFKTFPYSSIELTCLNGQSLILKPELIDSDDLNLQESVFMGQPGARIKFYVERYNQYGSNAIQHPVPGADPRLQAGHPIDAGEYLSASVGIENLPQMTMVNDNATALIAGQAHSLAWQYSNADWSQNKTMMGVNNAYAQSQLGAEYNSRANELAVRNRNAENGITAQNLNIGAGIAATSQQVDYTLNQAGAAFSGATGAASQLLGGNFGGALGAVLGTGANMAANAMRNDQQNLNREANLSNTLNTNEMRTAQANSYGSQGTALANQQSMQFADMNRSLATATAQGDYTNSISGINAKVQDTKLTQPSNSGMMGGDSFNFANGNMGLLIRFRSVPPAEMRNIGEFWLRFGYYVQRFMRIPGNLNVMKKFSYWKMHEAYILPSTCPEEFRLTIKGIFEKGVTVWAKPEYIGATDYSDNDPLPGVSY